MVEGGFGTSIILFLSQSLALGSFTMVSFQDAGLHWLIQEWLIQKVFLDTGNQS